MVSPKVKVISESIIRFGFPLAAKESIDRFAYVMLG